MKSRNALDRAQRGHGPRMRERQEPASPLLTAGLPPLQDGDNGNTAAHEPFC
jgi:hypothetical protein